jgi:hypothetical protein
MAALGCWAASCGGEKIGSGGSGTGGSSGTGGGGQLCTLIGCEDQFAAYITVDATMVPTGTHTVNVTADGKEMSCTFSSPAPAAVLGGIVVPCPSGVTLSLEPLEDCPPPNDAGNAGACQIVDGKFTETITIAGTPGMVHVQQLVGGSAVLDQTVTPAYQTDEPNGSGCGPICHVAYVMWTIP